MRVIVFGTGAIGGGVAASIARSGGEVTAIARGAQLTAIRDHGLHLRTPVIDDVVRFDVVETPEAAQIGPADAILLAIKGQHTQDALAALRDAGVRDQPIFCLQNGVGNEPRALRFFPNVHGVTVIMPATFVTPGEVVVQSGPKTGILYIGRFPGGSDQADHDLAAVLNTAGFHAAVQDDVMAPKHGKLLLNLANILGAALGPTADKGDLRDRMMAEAKAVYTAAGIAWSDVGSDHPDRIAHMNQTKVMGFTGVGTSTAQSLSRGAGSVETDWLNGEIVFLGRMHGVPVPVNAAMCQIAARMVREGLVPGSVTLAEVEAMAGRVSG